MASSSRKSAPRGAPASGQKPGPRPDYRPIEDYGIIGDLHSAALISKDGSIDWCCLPHFDSPFVFGAILDRRIGGYFRIAGNIDTENRQIYLPDTNILLTRFLTRDGVGEVVDFMPVANTSSEDTNHEIHRVVRCVRGSMSFRLDFVPAFNYARDPHTVERRPWGFLIQSATLSLALFSPVELTTDGAMIWGDFTLREGESAGFVLRCLTSDGGDPGARPPAPGETTLRQTVSFWHGWVGQMSYQGRWREIVTRSALVLKLLTFRPTGALVAAPTCSLPEDLGGVRNWDYRYTWIRDASFTLYALLRLGFSGEAAAFMGWLQNRLGELNKDSSLQIVYGLHGEHRLEESVLSHLEGYRGSKPVRIGNDAYRQPQLDIYGELMDAVYLFDKYGTPIPYDLWANLRRMLNYVAAHWRDADRGIWEVRTDNHHFVFSKLMCWVALDRGIRLSRKRSFPADYESWHRNRDAIYEEIMTKGWDPKNQTFVQHYGSNALDASGLLMPLVKFVSPTDPRMLSTLKAIRKALVSDSLVRRYEIGKAANDGLLGDEGTFSMCTFWYAEALARAGQVDEARWIFEKMLGYANHVGLFAEEIGPTGNQLGNFPQAFTHLGLISAAYNINRALDRRNERASAP